MFLANSEDVEVTGLTLSAEQQRYAAAQAKAAGLAGRASFHLRDYRQETGRYDRIVSVGMFEHVGVAHYGTFFRKLSDLLADDGVAVLHSIGRMEPPGAGNPWIRKYPKMANIQSLGGRYPKKAKRICQYPQAKENLYR